MQTSVSIERTRTRLVWAMFSGVAIGRTGFIMAVTVATLAAGEMAATRWTGLPAALGTIGVAAGATVFTRLSERLGRKESFTIGYATAASGTAVSALAVIVESFPLLLLGMFSLGLGQATSHLARYAAADLRSSDRRASAISLIVWAGTIGSVLGPLALEPAGDLAVARGLHDLVGPYAAATLLFGLGALAFAALLRPDPLELAVADPTPTGDVDLGAERSRAALFSLPSVKLALTAMALGQLVMVLVMTMTPLHLRNAGESLREIGYVMTAHTLGMFAVAPLTGWLVSRFGALATIVAGSVTLVAACALAIVGAGDTPPAVLIVALFLLGMGWTFCFVAGSTHLLTGLTLAERLHIQGPADTLTWVAGGAANLASGLIVSFSSYAVLSMLGVGLSVIPLVALARWRRPLPSAAAV